MRHTMLWRNVTRLATGVAGLAIWLGMSIAATGGSAGVQAQSAQPQTASAPTFHKDVLPILQKNCQSCHRQGQIGPMALLTYEGVRPWAKAIKAKVVAREMPPWFADPHYNQFANDRRLSDRDVATIVSWVDGGAVRRRRQGRAACRAVAGGRLGNQARSRRGRRRNQGAGEGHRRVDRRDGAERVHQGHLGHVNGSAPGRALRRAPRLRHV